MGDVLRRAAQLIGAARHMVVLTGAGISTPSGIPDFRSPGSGLWNHVDPYEVASIEGFRRNPQAYYRWRKPLMKSLSDAVPNAAHRALASMEASGLVHAVVTQNIDGLHQRAGSVRVLEVHGNGRELVCSSCGQMYADSLEVLRLLESDDVPYCWICGGVLKPNVVLFGERLPMGVMNEVERELQSCDLMLVAGSSLEVQPACCWPQELLDRGAGVIIVNYTETYLDARAAIAIHADVAEVLPALATAVRT